MLTHYYYFLSCRVIRRGYLSVWWFVDCLPAVQVHQLRSGSTRPCYISN